MFLEHSIIVPANVEGADDDDDRGGDERSQSDAKQGLEGIWRGTGCHSTAMESIGGAGDPRYLFPGRCE